MYRIPCECGLLYIGETGGNLSKCLKEHKTNCEKAELDKLAVAKHAWTYEPETSSISSNNPLVSFQHSKNIRETLVHSNVCQESSPLNGTFPCGVAQCKTCKFIDSSTAISAYKFTYNIKHNFMCTSTHLIYCISCSRCGLLYIGETGRQLKTRFGEHHCAVPANDDNQPVAKHFNSGSHCISDMKI